MGNVLLRAYGGLWRLAEPLLRRHKRLRDDFEERLVPDGWPAMAAGRAAFLNFKAPASLRLWIQAASAGEAWLLHSLLPAIVEEFASHPMLVSRPLHILCTSCTRQGMDVLAKLPELIPMVPPPADGESEEYTPPFVQNAFVFTRFFPLDTPELMEKALRRTDPHLMILLETEIWPGLLSAAKNQAVPVMVVNGRMTSKSFSGYRLFSRFWRENAPEDILAMMPEDGQRFAKLFGNASRVSLMSNIKFDRMAQTRPAAKASLLRTRAGIPDNALLVVLASVRKEEEKALLSVLLDLYGTVVEGCPVALAVAPRHMHRVEAWREKLSAVGLAFVQRSHICDAKTGVRGLTKDGDALPGPLPVYLWDSFGELTTLYAIADVAFVGGSLAPLGGQNFLEAPAQGIFPLVGPHIENFLWVGDDFFSQGLGRRVTRKTLSKELEWSLGERRKSLCSYPGGDVELDWNCVRRAEKNKARLRFGAWLSPRRGGSVQAARAVAAKLLALLGGVR